VNSGDTINLGGLNNTGYLYVGGGANMNMASGSVTDVVAGSTYEIYRTFTVGGVNSFFNSLNSVQGQVYLLNGQTTNITPGSGTLTNSGTLAIGNGSTVSITGDVLNNSGLFTGYYGGGGNTLNISGTLTNNSQFYLYGSGDVANVGTLVNNANLYIGSGATLNLTNQLNVSDIPSNATYQIYGTFNAGPNNAFASLRMGMSAIPGTLLSCTVVRSSSRPAIPNVWPLLSSISVSARRVWMAGMTKPLIVTELV
jgi:hypothetical protein